MKEYEPTHSEREAAQRYKNSKTTTPENQEVEENLESNEPEKELEQEYQDPEYDDSLENDEDLEDDDSDDDDSDDSDDDNKQSELFEIKANGESKKLTLEELKQFASQGIDYTKKTQELSNRIKTEVEKQVQERTADLDEKRNGLLEATELVESFYNKPLVTRDELQNLLDEGDLEQYNRLKDQEEQRKELLQEVKSQKERELAEKQQKAQESFAKYANQQAEILRNKMPELVKPDNVKKLTSYLRDNGYSEDELKYAADARALELAEKARRYDEIMSKGIKKPRKKANNPNVIRSNKRGSVKKVNKNLDQAKSKFSSSRSMRDAAQLLRELRKK
jgi:hypothetical protein